MSEEYGTNQEIQEAKEPDQNPQSQIRGLYDRVNISVRTLNLLIIVLSVLLVLCMGFGIAHRGYQVTFDSLGGTAVESQKRMYGETLEEPKPPAREGYAFDGWYRDENFTLSWNMQEDVITESITLYAKWKALQ